MARLLHSEQEKVSRSYKPIWINRILLLETSSHIIVITSHIRSLWSVEIFNGSTGCITSCVLVSASWKFHFPRQKFFQCFQSCLSMCLFEGGWGSHDPSHWSVTGPLHPTQPPPPVHKTLGSPSTGSTCPYLFTQDSFSTRTYHIRNPSPTTRTCSNL